MKFLPRLPTAALVRILATTVISLLVFVAAGVPQFARGDDGTLPLHGRVADLESRFEEFIDLQRQLAPHLVEIQTRLIDLEARRADTASLAEILELKKSVQKLQWSLSQAQSQIERLSRELDRIPRNQRSASAALPSTSEWQCAARFRSPVFGSLTSTVESQFSVGSEPALAPMQLPPAPPSGVVYIRGRPVDRLTYAKMIGIRNGYDWRR